MAVIGINYGEGSDDLNYQGVTLRTVDKTHVFNSGNFVKDWYDAKKMYINVQENEGHLSQSSSVDHFIMDGASDLYDSAYLHMVNGEPVLKYVDTSDLNYLHTQRDIYEGWEFFVPVGTQPTWKELKEMTK